MQSHKGDLNKKERSWKDLFAISNEPRISITAINSTNIQTKNPTKWENIVHVDSVQYRQNNAIIERRQQILCFATICLNWKV